jgi:hypothetical protein
MQLPPLGVYENVMVVRNRTIGHWHQAKRPPSPPINMEAQPNRNRFDLIERDFVAFRALLAEQRMADFIAAHANQLRGRNRRGPTVAFKLSALFNHNPRVHNVSFDVTRSAEDDLVSPNGPFQVTA